MEPAKEMILALLDSTKMNLVKHVNLALLIVQIVFLRTCAQPVSMDLSLLNFHGEELKLLTVLKNVVMVKDSSLIVTMEIKEIRMDAMRTVKSKKDGHAKEDQASKQALVCNMLLQDLSYL